MKVINDTLGHKEGDRALIATAAILRKNFRKADILARLGGDEFAVLVIDPKAEEVLLLERLQRNVDDFNQQKLASFSLSLSVAAVEFRDTDTGDHISRIGFMPARCRKRWICHWTLSRPLPLPVHCMTSARSEYKTLFSSNRDI